MLVIDLHFPEAGSLKSKRKELASIKAQLHTRLGAAVSEVAFQDLWQRARLTAALTGGSLRHAGGSREQRSSAGSTPAGPSMSRCERCVSSVEDLEP